MRAACGSADEYIITLRTHFILSVSPHISLYSEATKGSLDTECEVDNPTEACLDYGKFLDELMTVRKLVEQTQNKKSASLVQALQAIQLQTPQGTKVKSSPQLTAALDAAKLATSTHGVTSVEARLAWETYEEIASAGLDNSIGVNLMEECSVEAGADACRAIEELERVLPILLSLELQK
jgi:hypothetical protein